MIVMQPVVETPFVLAAAERLFSPNERRAIVERLASDPTCGVVIPGSGGIRKVRFGFGARGQERRCTNYLSVQWRNSARICSGGLRKKRESQHFCRRA